MTCQSQFFSMHGGILDCMAKLYTRTGDDGSTGLFGGGRVDKDDVRVVAYGTVDEFNASLGLVGAIVPTDDAWRWLGEMIPVIQSRLFDIGADLATPPGGPHEDKVTRFDRAHVDVAEGWIDEVEAANAPLTSFVLPGGTEVAARLHVSRGVCRRAERAVVTLGRTASITPSIVQYLNRVSDLMFAAARRANAQSGVDDVIWSP